MPKRKPRPVVLTWPQVHAFRMERHGLTTPNSSNLPDLCRSICGFQVQVMSAGRLQAAVRSSAPTLDDFSRALWKERSLVKTWTIRGTLHVIPSDDYPIYVAALRKSRLRTLRRYQVNQGVTEKEQSRVTEAAVAALDGGPMTKTDIANTVFSRVRMSRAAKQWFKLAWGSVIRQAVIEGRVCYAPDEGQESVFVRTDQWLKKTRKVTEEEAKPEPMAQQMTRNSDEQSPQFTLNGAGRH